MNKVIKKVTPIVGFDMGVEGGDASVFVTGSVKDGKLTVDQIVANAYKRIDEVYGVPEELLRQRRTDDPARYVNSTVFWQGKDGKIHSNVKRMNAASLNTKYDDKTIDGEYVVLDTLKEADTWLATMRDDVVVLTPAEKIDVLGPQIVDFKLLEAPPRKVDDTKYTKPQHPRSYRK